MNKYYYILIGIAIGWITKVPFLIKWYCELRKTNSYKKAMDKFEYNEMIDRYNKMYPNKPIKK